MPMSKASRQKLVILDALNISKVWEKDRWGHFKRTLETDRGTKTVRLKIQRTSIRFELKHGTEWINIASDYFKNIVLHEQSLRISTRVISLT